MMRSPKRSEPPPPALRAEGWKQAEAHDAPPCGWPPSLPVLLAAVPWRDEEAEARLTALLVVPGFEPWAKACVALAVWLEEAREDPAELGRLHSEGLEAFMRRMAERGRSWSTAQARSKFLDVVRTPGMFAWAKVCVAVAEAACLGDGACLGPFVHRARSSTERQRSAPRGEGKGES